MAGEVKGGAADERAAKVTHVLPGPEVWDAAHKQLSFALRGYDQGRETQDPQLQRAAVLDALSVVILLTQNIFGGGSALARPFRDLSEALAGVDQKRPSELLRRADKTSPGHKRKSRDDATSKRLACGLALADLLHEQGGVSKSDAEKEIAAAHGERLGNFTSWAKHVRTKKSPINAEYRDAKANYKRAVDARLAQPDVLPLDAQGRADIVRHVIRLHLTRLYPIWRTQQ
jgi:hypothetical protein